MREELFEKMPVPKAIMSLALPTMLGMMVTIIYNLADTFFVGQTGDEFQVGAVTIIMPIFMVLMAFGNLYGIGGGTYISRLLGAKQYEEAKKACAYAFYACIITGIVMTAFMLIFLDQILVWSGATVNTAGFAREYLLYIGGGAVSICLQQAMGQLIRAEGAAKQAVKGMMIGTFINILLDPFMILDFGLGLGVAGAGLATIVGTGSSILYYLYYFARKKTMLSISPKYFRPSREIAKNIFMIGIPVFLNNFLMSIANIVLNNYASGIDDFLVSGLGVSNRIFSIIIMLFIGLGQGMQPFVGYNYSFGAIDRMRHAIRFTIKVSIGMGLVFALCLFFGSEQMVRAFIDSAVVVDYGCQALYASMWVTPVIGTMFVFISVFQALGKASQSLFLSVTRQGLVFLPFVIIGAHLFGATGLIWAQPASDVVSLIMCLLFYFPMAKKFEQKLQKQAE